MFSDADEKVGVKRKHAHEPETKAYIDWAGDIASLTDRLTGAQAKVYVIVVALPYSDHFWAQGFTDMRQRSWQEGRVCVFEDFGGIPRMLVPDNAATATNRSSVFVTLVNDEHRRFAEHYGAAVVESTVGLVEKWITVPSVEMTFYTLEEFNGFCFERVRWLNSRPFFGCSGQCSTFV